MVYYNPYKQFIRALIRSVRVFISSLFSKRLLLIIIVGLIITLLHLNVNAVTYTDDLTNEIVTRQESSQNDLILEILPHYLDNDLEWQNIIKPIFDDILDYNKSVYVTDMGPSGNSNDANVQDLYTFYWQAWYQSLNKSEYVNANYRSNVTGQTQSIQYVKFNGNVTAGSQYYFDIYRFYMDNSTHNITQVVRTINTYGTVPLIIADYKSTLMLDFLTYYEGWRHGANEQINYTTILNDIESYVQSLDTSNTNIYNTLQSVLSVLNTIANKQEIDYTQQISGITSQMSSLIDKQQEVADNTSEMVQQQEEIKDGIDDLNNFLNDDSSDSSTILDNMPSNEEFQDVTQSGFDNIFTTLRNAFTSENYQDVVIGVPFSNGQTITIPSNLTENLIPEVIKNLIRMVYWFLISRFIVKDIASYIEKAKSGDIFSTSDTNIKTDML